MGLWISIKQSKSVPFSVKKKTYQLYIVSPIILGTYIGHIFKMLIPIICISPCHI